MTRSKRFLVIGLVALSLSIYGQAQVKFSGYFSFEYLKSQAEGMYPQGTFENLYGGLAASGVISGSLTFLTEVQARSQENFTLRQAYLSFQGSNLFQFKFGLFEIPFGQYNTSARPYQTLTVLRPLVFHFFPYRWSDLGICWESNYKIIYLSTYIINGLSADEQGYLRSTIKDVNKNKGAGGRLGLRFGEGVELGGSFYRGKYDSAGTKAIQFEGFDLVWVNPEWEVRGEYIKSIYDHPFLNQKMNFDGYYLIVSLVIKKLHPYFSYQKSAVPQWVLDDQNGPPLNIFLYSMVKKRRIAAGLKLDILDNFYAKLEYDWNKEKNISIKDNNLSIQLGFNF
ncbi:MAG: hypothetical protein ACPLZD_04165 [Candidatus Saccharicenans sp.]